MDERTPRIFEFSDFASFLVAYVEYRQKKHTWYSVRRLTKRAGLSSTAQLSFIMSRRRVPSLALVMRVCTALALTSEECRYAILLTELQHSRSAVLRELVEKELRAVSGKHGAIYSTSLQVGSDAKLAMSPLLG